MSTIVGVETESGTILAGDRVHVEGDTSVSDSVHRVFAFENAGAAAVGEPGATDEFERRLDSETQRYRIERERPIGIERLARTAGPIAEDAGVEAIVSARDDDSVARLRSIGRDGAVLSDTTVAFGSGAQLALGQLEGTDMGGDIDEMEEQVRDLFAAISERDSETGDDIETWTLENIDERNTESV